MTSLARHVKGSKAIGAKGELYRYEKKDTKIRAVKNRYMELGIDLDDTSISRPWTPDGEEALLDLFSQGYTVKKMCKELNRVWPDVGSRLVKLGMEKRLDPEGWPGEGNLYEGIEWP